MPRKDKFHDVVKRALIKDGWVITHDPYSITYNREALFVDMAAESPIGAEKEGRKIAVEIKSFLGKSGITDLYQALGQYLLYRSLIHRVEPDRKLYLAIPEEAYESVLDVAEGQALISEENLTMFLYDVESEVIEKWIE